MLRTKREIAQLRRELPDRLLDAFLKGTIKEGAEGIFFPIDKQVAGKLFIGSLEEAAKNASNTYQVMKEMYSAGVSIPEPYSYLPSLYTPYSKERIRRIADPSIRSSSPIVLMEHISDGLPLDQLDTYDSRRRKRCINLSFRFTKKDLDRIEAQYWEEAIKVYKLGYILGGDSAPHWNTLYSTSKDRIVLLDQTKWRKGNRKEREDFKIAIKDRHLKVSLNVVTVTT